MRKKRTDLELLQVLKETYKDNTRDYIYGVYGLCSIVHECVDFRLFNISECKRVIALIKKNKPSTWKKYTPWYFPRNKTGIAQRKTFLNKLIKKYSKSK